MNAQFSLTEARAIEQHRQALSAQRNTDVSFQEAREDWEKNFALEWRRQRLADCLKRQRIEIERHKWIESEKAGHDLGRDAVMDWIAKHAEEFRRSYDLIESQESRSEA